MSILISPLDLFWAVIKAHLPLRISIMISYTDIYEAHRLPGPTSISLIKSAALWIYSKACMINESEAPMQYHRLFHNFKTHSFTLTGSDRRLWVSRRCPSCVHEHLKTRQLLFFFHPAGAFNSSTCSLEEVKMPTCHYLALCRQGKKMLRMWPWQILFTFLRYAFNAGKLKRQWQTT